MLGELKKVDLRTIWKNEATDYTKWLAKEENLEILSEEIERQLNLKLEWQELPKAKASRIKIEKKGVNIKSENSNDESFKWLLGNAENFYKVFSKYL